MKNIEKIDEWMEQRTGKNLKTEGEVFDKNLMQALWKLISNGEIDTLDFPISTGKEANIFAATRNGERVAVKIYRISTATFKHILKYLQGFRGVKNRRNIIYEWTRKEYKNLNKLRAVGINVPEPILCHKNILIMEYIGGESPAPSLKQIKPKNPRKIFESIKRDASTMYKKARLVHADLSEYNILMDDGEPRIIDVGQTVSIEHPMARQFLEKDVHNLARYFKKFIKVDEELLLKEITNDL